MEINIEEQKQTFIDLCNSKITRTGLSTLLGWLEKNDFYTAPASTRYHGAYAGGLCQHSLDVYEYAKKLAAVCEQPLAEESLVICSLFHDLCKVNFYTVDYRNQKVDDHWERVPFYTIDEQLAYGGHGSKSVYLVQYCMRLKPEEAIAINCHMGFSEGGDGVKNVGKAYETYPLAWIIHAADEAATYLLKR